MPRGIYKRIKGALKGKVGTYKRTKAHRLKISRGLSGLKRPSIFGEKNSSYVHGMCNTVEYAAWRDMKRRCYNKKSENYRNYGGRGIVVCEEWKNSFVQFVTDMGRKPYQDYSIDRIDNNGNYCRENCRWTDKKTQQNNRRITKTGISPSSN